MTIQEKIGLNNVDITITQSSIAIEEQIIILSRELEKNPSNILLRKSIDILHEQINNLNSTSKVLQKLIGKHQE